MIIHLFVHSANTDDLLGARLFWVLGQQISKRYSLLECTKFCQMKKVRYGGFRSGEEWMQFYSGIREV